ncbi:nucleotide sugar dehydrogenase [Candidatus Venteria ishoeyi]|nr:nucleotide sugar dehydrogenase [Candidatus Venteria ishoeyi]SEH09235.1 UDP-N-acetyl-D-glucosamine 6-dehydrogenase [Candidatus Venteria ishoeyi]SEH09372.1 UDP-N-acetyl-D-glucosamine 6-dehydrogenase [Candidatus Venteria ishoeyi]
MHQRIIAVIGLGYVGLPAAVAFAKHGQVIGFDKNPHRIAELKQGLDRTEEVDSAALQAVASQLLLTTDDLDLKQANFFIIAVPTPIHADKKPDLMPVLRASQSIGAQLSPGDIVVYESTVYPGATEEVCVPVLERQSGLVCGRDFSVGYSPERINPGDKEHGFTNTIKVVSGLDATTLDVVADVYESVVTAGVHRASSIRVAEASKVIENTQRDMNIAVINELSKIF